MKEYEFKCKKCGSTWYVTDKDIRESREQEANIQRAKLQNNSIIRGKKYTARSAEIARMQNTQRDHDPYKCPNCGSRDIEKDGKTDNGVSMVHKILIALAVVFMPPLAIVFLLWKKPFSSRTNRICLIYCAVITCIFIAAVAFGGRGNSEPKEPSDNPEVTQSNVGNENGGQQQTELIYDVTQFSKLSGAELIGILGQPDSTDESTCNGSFEIPCVYYEYNNAEGLGEVSFVLVNNSVVRFTSYNEYPYTDGKEILGNFGIVEGENCTKAADTNNALRYRCPADGVDDFRAELIEGDTFGFLQVTYDMAFYEEWYLPVPMSDYVNYQTWTEEAVKSLLKSPKSADFAGFDGWSIARNQYYVAVQSYVDAQNSFGAELRSEFTFIYFTGTDTIAYAVFDGEVIADNNYVKTADLINGLFDAEKHNEALASVSAG